MIYQILYFFVLIICLVYGLALLSWLVMKLDIEKRRSKRTKFFERMGENLLEIEKLIEKLRDAGWTNPGLTDKQSLEWDAATALEQLQAENDRLRRERDAAAEDLNAIIGDIEEIRQEYGVDNYDADSAFADLCENYCANKNHRCYVEAEKYRCNNFKWRGPKEE